MRLLNRLINLVSVRIPRKRFRTSDSTTALYGILSTHPPIFYVAHWMDEQLTFICSLEVLFEYLKNQPAYFLYDWYWWIEDPARIAIVKRFENRHCRRYPKHQFIHLCNTVRQCEVFREKGLTAVFCNQNSMVDERIFIPLPAIPKIYDAVYDARLKSYKRHYLASKISNLALIYDFNLEVDDRDYVEQVKQEFRHAHFFNHQSSSDYVRLELTEVNRCLNACRVGLCLSEVEGAMYASIQYLLSGMPVVSTQSKGGRDVFFDEEYVLIVDDKPDAVRDGVEELMRRNIPAEVVRHKTLEKMHSHRRTLISLIQDIYEREGVERDFSAEWDRVFFDKLVRHQKHSETIKLLPAFSS